MLRFLGAAKERLRLLDRLLMPRLLGFLQLLVELRAHAREKAAAFDRLICLVLLRGLVVALVTVGADGNQVHIHHHFGRRTGRGVRGISVGTAGRPACSQAPAIMAATAAIDSFSRFSSTGMVPARNASK
jgi:hypothetical protein